MARRAPKQSNPLMRGNDIYWASAAYNQRLFIMFRQQIIDLALTRFRWVNLPPTCDSRYLEWTLLFQGCATIAHPKSDELEEHRQQWLAFRRGHPQWRNRVGQHATHARQRLD